MDGSTLMGNVIKVDRANERKERPQFTPGSGGGGGGYNDRGGGSYNQNRSYDGEQWYSVSAVQQLAGMG